MSLIPKLQQRFYCQTNTNISNTLFITGSGRSGTTWLGDIINYKNEYRPMFEPFHPNRVNLLKNFRLREYISPYEKNTPKRNIVEKVLSGQVRGLWVDSLNRQFFPRKRLIKAIRTHFMVRWIKNEYPQIPMILLLRHPFAVVVSKIKSNWNVHIDDIIAQKELFNSFSQEQQSLLLDTEDVFERHLVQWCAENIIPLTQFNRNELHLVFYERLCVDLENEIKGLFHFLNKEFDQSYLETLRTHSPSARSDSAIIQGKNPIESWREHMNDSQINRGLQILETFGLDKIYTDKLLPNVDMAWNMLGDENT